MRPVAVFRVSRRDSIGVICQAIESAQPGSQVWLVLPWRLGLARQLLNLRRLRHVAERAAVDLRLITRHLSTRQLAHEAGLIVHTWLPARLLKYAQRTRSKTSRRLTPVTEPLPRRFSRSPRRLRIGSALLALVVIVVTAVALAASVAAFLPSARVVMRPVSVPVSATLDVTASPDYRDVDYGQAIIPARSVQVIIEGRGDIPTSGTTEVADGYATGTVVFANRTDREVLVPQGTEVRSSAGNNARFYTLAATQLPARLYANAQVPIMAREPGPESNLRALTINVVEGEVGTMVDCINGEPTQGGTYRLASVVAQTDFERLAANLVETLQVRAYQQLVDELDADEFIPPESLDVQVMSRQFDQVLDQKTDALSGEMKVVARGVAISEAGLRRLGAQAIAALAEDGQALIEDSLVVKRGDLTASGTDIRFTADFSGYVSQEIDIARLRRALLALPLQDGLDWLAANFSLETAPEVTLSPPGWERFPVLPARIQVLVAVGAVGDE